MTQHAKLNLTVSPKPCKLDALKLTEDIDINTLNQLITSSLLRDTFTHKMAEYVHESERMQLKKYRELIADGKVGIKYRKTKGIEYGRVLPKQALGLFNIRRELRHTLAHKNYIDIDIENCHPVLLLQICEANDIPCEYLKKYVMERDAILEEVKRMYAVERDAAKTLFIQLMYFGSFNSWFNDVDRTNNSGQPLTDKPTQFISSFSKELQQIGGEIVSKNKELATQIKKKKEEQKRKYNEKGTVCSYHLQEYECQILEAVYLFCVKKKYITKNSVVLCADGLMIPKEHYNPKILDELTTLIKQELGFTLKFTMKPLDKGYTDKQLQEAQLPEEEAQLLLLDDGVKNDHEAAHVVFSLYPHWVCCDDELFVFDKETGLWSSKEQAHLKVINKLDKYLFQLVPTKDDGFKVSQKGYGNSTSLQRQMIPQLMSMCRNDNWMKEVESTSLGKLLFMDGWLNLRTNEFHETFDPNILFMYRIPMNYSQTEDAEYMDRIKNLLFITPLGTEEGEFLLLSIARAIAGDRLKRLLFGLGGTDGGKSTVTKALTNSFGEYVSVFNAENLIYNQNSSDEAAKLRWCFLLRHTRLIISNELKKDKELDGNSIKKVSSGGDTLVGRVHGGLETKFTPQFNCFILANDLPKITPYDDAVNKRVNIVRFSKTFIDGEPTNEFQLKKDVNIEVELETKKFQFNFMKLIINRYVEFIKGGKVDVIPQAVLNAKVDWIGDDADTNVINKFLTEFEISNNAEHFIESSNIQQWLEQQKLGISFKKFSIELKKYITIKKFSSVESKDKKVYGRVTKVWTGITRIEDTEPEFIHT